MLNIVHYFGVKKLIFGRQQNRGGHDNEQTFLQRLEGKQQKKGICGVRTEIHTKIDGISICSDCFSLPLSRLMK